MLIMQVSCSLRQYSLVCFCQSKSCTLWHFISTEMSRWCTCTVTRVSILVLYKAVSIGSRHRLVNSRSIFSIYFFFDSKAPLFSFWLFSKASVIFCVQISWIPIKLTCERVVFTKLSKFGFPPLTAMAAFLQCYLIVSCISFSSVFNQD